MRKLSSLFVVLPLLVVASHCGKASINGALPAPETPANPTGPAPTGPATSPPCPPGTDLRVNMVHYDPQSGELEWGAADDQTAIELDTCTPAGPAPCEGEPCGQPTGQPTGKPWPKPYPSAGPSPLPSPSPTFR